MKLILMVLIAISLLGCSLRSEDQKESDFQEYVVDRLQYGKDAHGICYAGTHSIVRQSDTVTVVPCDIVGL